MSREEIRFGLRRYPLAMAIFGGGSIAFLSWSRTIERPTFVFPFGRLDPASASHVFALVGIAAGFYGALMTYIRFVRRPVVALGDGEISIPVGEFGHKAITLRKGDVVSVRQDGPRRGGWRTCYVQHRGGTLAVRSSQVPSDEAFFKICERIKAL